MSDQDRHEMQTLGRAMTAAAKAGFGTSKRSRSNQSTMPASSPTMATAVIPHSIRQIPEHMHLHQAEERQLLVTRRQEDNARANLLRATSESAKGDVHKILEHHLPEPLLHSLHVGPCASHTPLRTCTFSPPSTSLALQMVAAQPKGHIKEHQKKLKGLRDGFLELHDHIKGMQVPVPSSNKYQSGWLVDASIRGKGYE